MMTTNNNWKNLNHDTLTCDDSRFLLPMRVSYSHELKVKAKQALQKIEGFVQFYGAYWQRLEKAY